MRMAWPEFWRPRLLRPPPARLARSSDLTLALDPGLPAPPLAGLAQPHLSSCVCPVRRLQSTSSCKPASSPRPPSSSRRRSACRCSSRRRCASTCSSPSSTSPRRWRRCCWASSSASRATSSCSRPSASRRASVRVPASHPPTLPHTHAHTRARAVTPPLRRLHVQDQDALHPHPDALLALPLLALPPCPPSSPSPICDGCDARCWRDSEGRNSSSSLPPLSLINIDSLRVRLRVLVGNGAAQTSGRYIDIE